MVEIFYIYCSVHMHISVWSKSQYFGALHFSVRYLNIFTTILFSIRIYQTSLIQPVYTEGILKNNCGRLLRYSSSVLCNLEMMHDEITWSVALLSLKESLKCCIRNVLSALEFFLKCQVVHVVPDKQGFLVNLEYLVSNCPRRNEKLVAMIKTQGLWLL
jgi:hypothetical protein